MTRLSIHVSLLVAVVVTLGMTSTPAHADCVTPAGSVTSTPVSADGTQRIFSGVIYPFGAVKGALVIHPNVDGSFTGQFAMQAKGGVVYGTLAGYFTSPFTYVETITFTGGTGRYAGIYGEAEVMGAFNPDGTGTDSVTGGQVCLQ
jgi:hypothetical protein